MQKIAIFHNPHAATATSGGLIKKVQDALFRSEVSLFPLMAPTELKIKIKELVENGYQDIVLIGGDGSVNLMIQELADQNVGLLIIPGGTANDLARELGIRRRVTEAISSIRENRFKSIDLISVNGRYFATNGGVGIGANVTDRLNEIRKKVHGTKYLLRILRHHAYSGLLASELMLPFLPIYNLTIEYADKRLDVQTPLMIINNQEKIAGTIKAGDGILNDDGLMNVLIFTHKSRLKLVRALIGFVIGRPIKNDPELLKIETDKMTIKSKDKTSFKFFGDGEVFGSYKKIELKVLPRSLKVYTPRTAMNCLSGKA